MAAQTNRMAMNPSECGWEYLTCGRFCFIHVFSYTNPPLTTYFQWPALSHFLFHKYGFSIYWLCSILIHLSGDWFLKWWVFGFKPDNQCPHALLAQIYHVCLLLLLQIEIARCLIIIIMRFMKHLLSVLYGVGYLIMMRTCMNLWSKPSGWWTLWISSSLLTQIYHYKGQYHSDKNVSKYI